jgi:adenylate cyclase
LRKHLRQFVPEQIFQLIEASSGSLQPASHEATILFSDIRGFTSMIQHAAPDAVAAFLNECYFAPMGEIAYRFNGIVDKHIGDSIMLVFGAPLPQPDDACRAVKAAVAMQQKARQIDCQLAAANGFRLKTGIGIATGQVFSGLIGSLRRKEFTVIGPTVNVAARLQHQAGPWEIIISAATHAKSHAVAERLPSVQVKGIDQAIEVYRVCYDGSGIAAEGGPAVSLNPAV